MSELIPQDRPLSEDEQATLSQLVYAADQYLQKLKQAYAIIRHEAVEPVETADEMADFLAGMSAPAERYRARVADLALATDHLRQSLFFAREAVRR